jgi:hypothetical protein
VSTLTARELNVLLTWASGGTPEGGAPTIVPAAGARGWPLGTPDAVRTMPTAVTIPADVQEHIAEFTIPTGLGAERWLRAVDLLPGTPAVVRSATVSIKSSGQLLALWVPGDHPVPLEGETAFRLPDGAELLLRVRYRKTWEHEHESLTDRSSIGLYFADPARTEVRALPLTIGTNTIAESLRALAISPPDDVAQARVSVMVIRPDGSREEVIAFRPRPGWARRYWFAQPIALPRGTRIDVRATFGEDGLLPPGTLQVPVPADTSKVRLTLDVVPVRP